MIKMYGFWRSAAAFRVRIALNLKGLAYTEEMIDLDAGEQHRPDYCAINPAASVPAGVAADGLPVAVQLVGRTDDEATLFSLSAQLEQARPWPLLAGAAA